MKAISRALTIGALGLAATAVQAAPQSRLDLPAGRLSEAVAALSAQTGVSVATIDPALWNRRVPAVRGRMSARDALGRLLGGSGAKVVAVDAQTLRIVPGKPAPPRRKVAPAPLPTVEESGEDIVVVASKRDTRLRDFPGMASLFDGEDLRFGGERGTESILIRLASVSSTHLGAGRNKLFIRGIADSSFTGPTQATVGQYLGDLRLTYNAPDPDLRLYDMASVEVLEGPQATLYGAGSLGGIIRLVPNAPRLGQVEGSASMGFSFTQHGDPGADLGGTLNLPVAEGMAARVTGYVVSDGGYIDNPLLGEKNINRTRVTGGRGTLRFAPGDGWTIDVGGVIQSTHGADSQYADRDAPALTRSSPIAQGFDSLYKLGELVVAKDWGDLRFLSSTGIVGQTLDERYDATQPGDTPRLFTQDNATRLFSTENRLSRPMLDGWGGVIGATYIDNRTKIDRALGPIDAPAPVTGVTNRVREATVYGELSVQFAPWLTATAGGRYTHSRLSGEGRDVFRVIDAAMAKTAAARTEDALLPSVALTATPLSRLTVYARYQEGFRPGGLTIEDDFVRRFRSDRVRAAEAGIRLGAPGHDRFDFAVSLSHTRWDDIQADFIDAAGLPSTANIGDGRIWSVAINAGWMIVPGLRVDGGAAFNDSKVTRPDAELFRLALARMSRIPNVARYAVRGGVDYRTPLNGDLDLHVAALARYIGRSRLGIGPELGEPQGNYLDSSLSARVGREGLGVTISVTNLTDEIGNRFALGTPFTGVLNDQITPLRPRALRIGLDTSF